MTTRELINYANFTKRVLYNSFVYLLKADRVPRAGLPAKLPVTVHLPVGIGQPSQVLAKRNSRAKD